MEWERNALKKIDIPPIYEEDIIEFVFCGTTVKVKYHFENAIISLVFNSVYKFDFCEFDYICETHWEFGLTQYSQSPLLDALFSIVPFENRNRAFGGKLQKLRHYKLVVDDVGIYNIICRDFQIEKSVRIPVLWENQGEDSYAGNGEESDCSD